MSRAVLLSLLLVAELVHAGSRGQLVKNQGATGPRSAFAQASQCGLPRGELFPGYLGRCIASVNAAGTAEVTQCYDANGAAVTTTQGASPRYECAWTPPGGGDCIRAQADVTDTSAAFVPAADAQALLGSTFWSGDHTVYVVNAPGATVTEAASLSHGAYLEDGFYLSTAGGTQSTCVYSAAAAHQPVALSFPLASWRVASCSRSGTNYVSRANGTESVQAVTTTAANPSAKNIYFGRYSGTGLASRGPLAAVYFFNAGHDSATKTRFEKQVQCAYGSTPSGQVAITDTVSGARFEVGPVEKVNLLAFSENLEQSPTWLAVSSPVIAANAVPGPDGGMADTITASAITTSRVQQGITADGRPVTLQGWVKSITPTAIPTFRVFDNTTASSLCSASAGVQYPDWTYVTCTTAATTPGNALVVHLYPSNIAGGTSAFTAIKLEPGNTTTPYVRTFADPRPAGPFVFAHGDNARWATPDGIYSGTAVTNSLLHRRILSTGWTLTNMTAATTAGLDRGTASATRLTASAANATAIQQVQTGGGQRTDSIHIKRVTGTGAVEISADNGATYTALDATNCFDLATGATGTAINTSAHVRCKLTQTNTTLATPVNAAFSTATTGGTLAAGTYYYRVSALNAMGETLASTETNQATTGTTSTVTVNWGAVTGATGYKVYGRSTGAELLMATVGAVTTWTDDGSVTPAGALPARDSSADHTLALRLAVNADAVDVDYVQMETGAIAMPPCDNPTQTAAATCNDDNHTIPAPTGPTITEGCAKVCVTPSHTGANPYGGETFYLDPQNGPGNVLLSMTSGATVVGAQAQSGAQAIVAHGFVTGVESCFITDWSASGNFLRVTNATTGAVGTPQAFTGFTAFSASWEIGGLNGGGGFNANASVKLAKVGSGPGRCQ